MSTMRTVAKAGTVVGVAALGLVLAAPAFAATGTPTPTPTHSTATPAPVGTKLTVTLQAGRPGQKVLVRAVAKPGGVFERGSAQSFAFVSDVALDAGDGAGAVGTAVLKKNIKAGTYKVTVTGGKDGYGIGWLKVLPPKSDDGTGDGGKQTTVVPKGGAKTGGGGASATGTELPLIAGGAAIALLGAGAATVAIRRRRTGLQADAA